MKVGGELGEVDAQAAAVGGFTPIDLLTHQQQRGVAARADFGALLNYSFFGGMIRDLKTGTTSFNGANAFLDGRVMNEDEQKRFARNAIVYRDLARQFRAGLRSV